MTAAKKLAAVTDEVDLDALFADIDVTPRPVKLGGRTWMVRRDLTSAELVKFWQLAGGGNDAGALQILIVEEAAALSAAIDALPAKHSKPVLDAVLEAGQVPGRKGAQGE